ncbi:MAG: hypothetical protein ACYCW6_04770 [Candidatus Xenobia bacterium]
MNQIRNVLTTSPPPQARSVAATPAASQMDLFETQPLGPKHQRVFTTGQPVSVVRSSGAREGNWYIDTLLDDGRVRVTDGTHQKDYSPNRLLMDNPHLLPKGMTLNVRRTSGQVESGWNVSHAQGNGLLLMEKGNIQRATAIADLIRENPDLVPPHVARGADTGRLQPVASPPPPPAPVYRPMSAAGALAHHLAHGMARPAEQSVQMRPVSLQETQHILTRVRFADNPMGFRPKDARDLTTEFLQTRKLGPQTAVQIGDTHIYLSQPYSHDGERTAFVGYVEGKDGTVHVCTFYQSNSQGYWRSASHCGLYGWIGKGKQSEESTNLPIALQKPLSQLAAGGVHSSLSAADSNTAFYGNLPLGGHEPPAEFADSVEVGHFGSFTRKTADGRYGEPGSFQLDHPGQGPDYDHPEDRYRFEHPTRGTVEATIYRSRDGQLRYQFLKDSKGRAWLGAVEDASAALNSYGVRTRALDPGDLTMPAVEYDTQVPRGYAGPHEFNSYVDASQYTHQLPLVRAFLNSP